MPNAKLSIAKQWVVVLVAAIGGGGSHYAIGWVTGEPSQTVVERTTINGHHEIMEKLVAIDTNHVTLEQHNDLVSKVMQNIALTSTFDDRLVRLNKRQEEFGKDLAEVKGILKGAKITQ